MIPWIKSNSATALKPLSSIAGIQGILIDKSEIVVEEKGVIRLPGKLPVGAPVEVHGDEELYAL